MANSRKLAEYDVVMIETEIKTKIAQALSDVRVDRSDAAVSTEPPKRYLRYTIPGGIRGYETPTIFTILDRIQMMNADKLANHISAKSNMIVSVLVEDRILDNLVKKSWRYQAALHKILHLTALTSSDETVKLIIKVEGVRFSPEFTDTKEVDKPGAVFRKEVALDLEVEHYENL